MMNDKLRNLLPVAMLSMVLLISLSQHASGEELINCPSVEVGGDGIDRGFYVPDYPGTTLDRVDLTFAPAIAGEYTIRLTARDGAYDGPVIGVVDNIETFTVTHPAFSPVSFFFPVLSVEAHSTVTFTLELIAGEPEIYYDTHTDFQNCPIVQTHGTTPPLDSPRSDGIVVVIHGTATSPAEQWSWGVIKAAYR